MGDLTLVQKEFLKILESFMHEKNYSFPEDFSYIKELYEMAAIHKMTAVVYEQIRLDPLTKRKEYAGIINAFKSHTIHEVIFQTQREDGFIRIYKRLCGEGLHPLVVKGCICRNLYAKPDYRVSSDEDMFLREEEFETCDRILLEEGFKRNELDFGNLPQEIPYRHPQSGVYIELHFKLFAEESGAYGHLNQEFYTSFDTCISEDIHGVCVWTLEPTLHMFYLICHSFKHFLHSGFGIRQVCDMVMMAEHYGEIIDWGYIKERLKQYRMDGFWSALLEIGIKYLGFTPDNSVCLENMLLQSISCRNLLLDLFESGVFGNSTMERRHSSNITLAAAQIGKKDMKAAFRASLFPDKCYMEKGYPWIEKYPALLPWAWILRIGRYLIEMRKNTDEPNVVEIGMDRVELLKEYRIIDS